MTREEWNAYVEKAKRLGREQAANIRAILAGPNEKGVSAETATG